VLLLIYHKGRKRKQRWHWAALFKPGGRLVAGTRVKDVQEGNVKLGRHMIKEGPPRRQQF
jgi:hypothetical protein